MITTHTKNRLLLFLTFIAFVSLGLPDGLLGVAWPSIASQFARPLSRLALLQLAATCGFFFSSTNAGRLIERLGVGRLLIASNVMVFIALSGFSFADRWPLIVGSMVVLGMGGGAVDAGLNAYSASRFTKEQITLMHAFYGLGAMIGPVIMRRVLHLHAPWQRGYLITLSMIALLLLLFIVSQKMWNGGVSLSSDADKAGESEVPGRIKNIGMLLFFVYTGVEVTTGGWSFTWLTKGRGVTPETAAFWVGIYWGALMVGRLFFGFLGQRWHTRTILSRMVLVVAAGCLLFLQPWSSFISLVALPVIGFSCAPLFPLFVSYTPTVVGQADASRQIGRQVACASIGSAVVPLLVGLGVEITALGAIPVMLLFFALILVILYNRWVAGLAE
ncbi:MFS transporter [Sediminispirochaeta smaragdinae]|jgi:fucose permease|uniref:Major facilitator superfamily MFS_1 n=1 Tax=Sediminispirochaeta smaragdinae (strain DSM 11293 / JCM 15392 / SEBR 4228) TaxID=573413 RepID=E1RAZ7_SEDSS|nr:MFS transporter [Sediminispirochaeta smaragdinae]ADK79527.1 major facilitator superfamily MFS_1 [Sediminispirochaeta smaragdinae DSM 11293]